MSIGDWVTGTAAGAGVLTHPSATQDQHCLKVKFSITKVAKVPTVAFDTQYFVVHDWWLSIFY